MPPKSKRTTKPREQFLFVNEDSNTLSRSARNTEVESSKQSHVQWQSFAKRKGLPHGGKKTNTASPSPSDSASTPISNVGQSNSKPPSDISGSNLPLWESENVLPPEKPVNFNESPYASFGSYQPGSEAPLWNTTSDIWLEGRLYDLTRSQKNRIEKPPADLLSATSSSFPKEFEDISTVNLSNTSVVDPFTNAQAALELWVPPLMKYFTIELVSELFHTDLKAVDLPNMRHVNHLHEDMTFCMSNPAEMYALLAASACHAMGRDGCLHLPNLAQQDSGRVILLFISKALEAIRHRLAGGTLNQRTVIAVQRMVSAALYVRNFSAAEAHYRAAISMMEQVGGLETFDDFQKERMIMEDLCYALCTKSRPKFKPTWDPGSLNEKVNSDHFPTISRKRPLDHSSRLESCISETQTTLVIAQAIEALEETQHVQDWLRSQRYISAQYRWLVQRKLSILHQLLTVQATETVLTSSAVLERLLHLSLICYMLLTENVSLWHTAFVEQYIIPETQRWKTNDFEDTFESLQDILLWVLVLFGTMLTPMPGQNLGELAGQKLEVLHDVIRLGKRVTRFLEIESKSQLRDLLNSFLFDDEIIGKRYFKFVSDLEIE